MASVVFEQRVAVPSETISHLVLIASDHIRRGQDKKTARGWAQYPPGSPRPSRIPVPPFPQRLCT